MMKTPRTFLALSALITSSKSSDITCGDIHAYVFNDADCRYLNEPATQKAMVKYSNSADLHHSRENKCRDTSTEYESASQNIACTEHSFYFTQYGTSDCQGEPNYIDRYDWSKCAPYEKERYILINQTEEVVPGPDGTLPDKSKGK